jgi:hypothetical protein
MSLSFIGTLIVIAPGALLEICKSSSSKAAIHLERFCHFRRSPDQGTDKNDRRAEVRGEVTDGQPTLYKHG